MKLRFIDENIMYVFKFSQGLFDIKSGYNVIPVYTSVKTSEGFKLHHKYLNNRAIICKKDSEGRYYFWFSGKLFYLDLCKVLTPQELVDNVDEYFDVRNFADDLLLTLQKYGLNSLEFCKKPFKSSITYTYRIHPTVGKMPLDNFYLELFRNNSDDIDASIVITPYDLARGIKEGKYTIFSTEKVGTPNGIFKA